MNRLLLTSATLGALMIAPTLAQQPGGSQANPAEVAPTQRAPATMQNPSSTANQRSASDSQSTVSMQADILAETLQGLTVYTTKTDNNTAMSSGGAARTDNTGNVRTDAAGRPLATGSVSSSNSAPSSTVGTEARLLTKAELKTMTDQAQNIGEVNDLLIGLDGKVNRAIIDVGGFLGVGERSITLSWSDLKIVKTNDGDVVAFIDKSKADLNAMPQYQAPANR